MALYHIFQFQNVIVSWKSFLDQSTLMCAVWGRTHYASTITVAGKKKHQLYFSITQKVYTLQTFDEF